jgi:folylpolyglutamate synthase
VTLIDYDHMDILGATLDLIAKEKAGIFKRGCPAITSSQQETPALRAIQESAKALDIELVVLPPLDTDGDKHARLGLAGDHQLQNAALAVELARVWLTAHPAFVSDGDAVVARAARSSIAALPHKFKDGLANTSWPGRCQTTKVSPHLTMYIDGAHTQASMQATMAWFTHTSHNQQQPEQQTQEDDRVLLFNTAPTRDPIALLGPLLAPTPAPTQPFSCVLSCPFDDEWGASKAPGLSALLAQQKSPELQLPSASSSSSSPPEPNIAFYTEGAMTASTPLSWQHTLLEVCWCYAQQQQQTDTELVRCASVRACVELLIQRATDTFQRHNTHTHVLVTGSLYLAGNMLHALENQK